jgi:hypothetical protein
MSCAVRINSDHLISVALRSNECESRIHPHEAMLTDIRRIFLDDAGACSSKWGATTARREL